MKVKLNSNKSTPEKERVYVIETPSVDRRKVRGVDIDNELKAITTQLKHLKDREVELKEIKKGIDKLK